MTGCLILLDAGDPRGARKASEWLHKMQPHDEVFNAEVELAWRFRHEFPETARGWFAPQPSDQVPFARHRVPLGDPVARRYVLADEGFDVGDETTWDERDHPLPSGLQPSAPVRSRVHLRLLDWARTTWKAQSVIPVRPVGDAPVHEAVIGGSPVLPGLRIVDPPSLARRRVDGRDLGERGADIQDAADHERRGLPDPGRRAWACPDDFLVGRPPGPGDLQALEIPRADLGERRVFRAGLVAAVARPFRGRRLHLLCHDAMPDGHVRREQGEQEHGRRHTFVDASHRFLSSGGLPTSKGSFADNCRQVKARLGEPGGEETAAAENGLHARFSMEVMSTTKR